MTTPHRNALTATLFATAKPRSEQVESAEWGITIELRGMSMGERSKMLSDCFTNDEKRTPIYVKFYPTLLRACCFDPATGAALFEGVSNDEINTLPAPEVERIAALCLKLSGLDAEASKALGNGSGGTPTSTSDTFSPAPSGEPSTN